MLRKPLLWVIFLLALTYVMVFNYGGCLDSIGSSSGTNSGSSGAPAQVTSPNPTNGATVDPYIQQLSWTSASGATSYDVYFGTTSPGTFKINTTSTNYNPGRLSGITLYYWRIDSKNDSGTTTGNVWSFTTLVDLRPFAPSDLYATHSQSIPFEGTHYGESVWLSWTDNSNNEANFIIERKVVGTNTYEEISTVAQNVNYVHLYAPSNVTYYYRVRARNSYGYSNYSNEVSFTDY